MKGLPTGVNRLPCMRYGACLKVSSRDSARPDHPESNVSGSLRSGWAESLLKTGMTIVAGQPLNLNDDYPEVAASSPWIQRMYVPNGMHNNHIHIELDQRLAK